MAHPGLDLIKLIRNNGGARVAEHNKYEIWALEGRQFRISIVGKMSGGLVSEMKRQIMGKIKQREEKRRADTRKLLDVRQEIKSSLSPPPAVPVSEPSLARGSEAQNGLTDRAEALSARFAHRGPGPIDAASAPVLPQLSEDSQPRVDEHRAHPPRPALHPDEESLWRDTPSDPRSFAPHREIEVSQTARSVVGSSPQQENPVKTEPHSGKRQPAYPRALAAFEAMKKQPTRIWSFADLALTVPLNLKSSNDNPNSLGTTIRTVFLGTQPFSDEVTIIQQGRYYLAKLTNPEKYPHGKGFPFDNHEPAVETVHVLPDPPKPTAPGLPPHLVAQIEPAIESRDSGRMSFLLGKILGWHEAQAQP